MSPIRTQHKIALASTLANVVCAARRSVGLSPRVLVRRRNIAWDLDLREGIDFSIFLLGTFEPETVRAYRRLVRPGALVLDIGANVGAHVLHLAQMVGPTGRVVAFEPTDYAFEKLRRNLALNPQLAARIDARQAFLGSRADTSPVSSLYASWPLEKGTDLHSGHGGRLMSSGGARQACLDDEVGDSPVKLIKMDVDGHECGVLRGAKELLRARRPVIVTELAPYQLEEMGSSVQEFLAILREARYSLSNLRGTRSIAMDARRLQHEIPKGSSRNVLAHPLP